MLEWIRNIESEAAIYIHTQHTTNTFPTLSRVVQKPSQYGLWKNSLQDKPHCWRRGTETAVRHQQHQQTHTIGVIQHFILFPKRHTVGGKTNSLYRPRNSEITATRVFRSVRPTKRQRWCWNSRTVERHSSRIAYRTALPDCGLECKDSTTVALPTAVVGNSGRSFLWMGGRHHEWNDVHSRKLANYSGHERVSTFYNGDWGCSSILI